jgi:hypothetical protein
MKQIGDVVVTVRVLRRMIGIPNVQFPVNRYLER